MRLFKNAWIPGLLLVSLMAACGAKEPTPEPTTEPTPAPEPMPEPLAAKAELMGREGLAVTGSVTFTETADGVEVVAQVSGVEAGGQHGFHIHEIGDCSSADFKSTGGHFNPEDHVHGGPSNDDRHAGDLGNIEIDAEGNGSLTLVTNRLTVAPGPNSVVGRGLILHEKADDLVSQPTGAAGSRIGCGVIEKG